VYIEILVIPLVLPSIIKVGHGCSSAGTTPWLLEKVGRKWKLKKGALQVISHFLKLIGEIEYLLGDMENTVVRTFGIRGIITVDKQEMGITREMERIQSYNSP
jgi:hypothetical protein